MEMQMHTALESAWELELKSKTNCFFSTVVTYCVTLHKSLGFSELQLNPTNIY